MHETSSISGCSLKEVMTMFLRSTFSVIEQPFSSCSLYDNVAISFGHLVNFILILLGTTRIANE